MLRGALAITTRALFVTLLLASIPVHAQTAPPAQPPAAAQPAAAQPAAAQPAATLPPAELAVPAPGAETTALTQTGEPTLESKERARVAYTRGQTAFSQGRYDVALEAFQTAFTSVQNPIVLLSVAEAQARLGQYGPGADTLRKYLELVPAATDRAAIEEKISAWSTRPAILAIASEPAGATLTLDGVALADKSPTQVELPPGPHTLGYTLEGYEPGSETVTIAAGTQQELTIALRPVPPPAAAPVAALEAKAEVPAGPPTTAIWITGGIGAAGIITGTVLGFLALKEQSDFDTKPSEAGADRGERLALFSDVGFGVGVMALATAAVLLFTGDEPEEQPNDVVPTARRGRPSTAKLAHPAGPRLSLIPQLSPTTAAATARLQF